MNRRLYQQAVLNEFIRSNNRFWALLWERQAGKSTTMAEFALYEMLRHRNRTVIYGSASLLLAQEITLKTAVRANQTRRARNRRLTPKVKIRRNRALVSRRFSTG
jgi:hypothetical protein